MKIGRKLRQLKSEFNAELWCTNLHRLMKFDSGNVNLWPMKVLHPLE